MWHNHSLIETKTLQYYTFGRNDNDECTLYHNDKDEIVSPYGINGIIKRQEPFAIQNVYLDRKCT